MPVQRPNAAPLARIYLYGASNLWLSRHAALATMRAYHEGFIDIGLACGPGRSYGLRAGNPLARYRALREVDFPIQPAAPTLVLLTDAGNDIAYKLPATTTLDWITELAQYWESRGAQVALGGVPIQSLRQLPPLAFRTLSRLYYNEKQLTFQKVITELDSLEDGLRSLCLKRGYRYLESDPTWYGLDHVHLKPQAHFTCWENLGRQLYPHHQPAPRVHPRGLWKVVPAEYWLGGCRHWRPGLYSKVLPQTRLWVR